MRGEHVSLETCPAAHVGSSPHAWGTHSNQALDLCGARFIPTCVGNTNHPASIPRCAPVHPHMRGEHNTASAVAQDEVGSSPHAWGTRVSPAGERRNTRFIPTCVGNTDLSRN